MDPIQALGREQRYPGRRLLARCAAPSACSPDAQPSEIEKIAREHAAEMHGLRDLLDKTMKAGDDQALRDAVREHAELRDALG